MNYKNGIIVDLTQQTSEWHQFRIEGLGSSDAPVVEGLSPYKTPRQLFFEKKGIGATEEDDSKAFIFEKGHQVETLARAEFQRLIHDDMTPVCMKHAKYDFLRCSLDGFNPRHGTLEAKFVGKDVLAEARKGRIPDHHNSQMQHQFMVSGADIGRWYGHDGKKDGALIEVRRDEEYIKRLFDKELAFWDALQKNNAPPLSERDYLVPIDQSLLVKLRDAKEFAENAQAYFESLKEEVVNFYRHNKIAGGGLKIWRSTREGSLNILKIPEISKLVEAERAKLEPAYIEQFRGKSIESWTVKIDEKVVKKAKG